MIECMLVKKSDQFFITPTWATYYIVSHGLNLKHFGTISTTLKLTCLVMGIIHCIYTIKLFVHMFKKKNFFFETLNKNKHLIMGV